ncbi:GNAT family N-acetyltransferase [Emticicia soli]|uniref:GNAT family N-acetyltransferase n=1 Tax=Emticicia soli TaxID=2027878 RepID=A0ABW5J9S1_9BACT
MFYIESERLRLIPLNLHQLHIYNNPEALVEKLALKDTKIETEPLFQNEFDDALQNYWIPMVEKNPDDYVWFTNWLVVQKQENLGIGGIGLAGLPNENGESEIGYGIDLKQRGKGYATEALVCLSQWAFQNENLKIIVAHTPLDLLNSQRVLQKAGFLLIKTENELLRWELKRA